MHNKKTWTGLVKAIKAPLNIKYRSKIDGIAAALKALNKIRIA